MQRPVAVPQALKPVHGMQALSGKQAAPAVNRPAAKISGDAIGRLRATAVTTAAVPVAPKPAPANVVEGIAPVMPAPVVPVPRPEPVRIAPAAPIAMDVQPAAPQPAVVEAFVQQAAPAFEVPAEAPISTEVSAEAVVAEAAAGPVAPKKQVRIPAFDMDLPGEPQQSLFDRLKSRKVRRLAFRGLAIGMVLIITIGGLLASQAFNKTNKVFRGTTGTAAALKKDVNPDLLDGEGSGRVNILILGKGGGSHSAPDLTDTLMIASIDPVNKTSTLLSIPRDMWVTVPNQGVMKLNAAWEIGAYRYQGTSKNNPTDPNAIKAGFNLADQTIEDITGLHINYNMIVDFDAFKQAIDSVSGVNVNVPTDLVDPTMAWENANDPVLAHAGAQVMNGNKALQYVRSRETSSDFARAERQRAVMVALKGKIVSLGTLSNPLKISELINSFGNNVSSDLSVKNAARLYQITKDIPDASTTSLSLNDPQTSLVQTGNINGQSVVLPKAGLFKYDAIKTFLRAKLIDPFVLQEKAKVMVLNGTQTPGVATAMSNDLKSYGYNVVSAANAPTTGWTQTTVVDLSKGKNKYTRHYLEQRFNTKARTTMPDDTIATNAADFVIIVGSDKANPTQTQTH